MTLLSLKLAKLIQLSVLDRHLDIRYR